LMFDAVFRAAEEKEEAAQYLARHRPRLRPPVHQKYAVTA
jgi:hypothetical protein